VPHPGRPPRAPALHVTGRLPGAAPSYRLPLPPIWPGRSFTARAAERRARKAYFAALDALHLGCVNEEAVGRLQRLVADARGGVTVRPLEHLLRVFGFVRRSAGRPALVAPAEPLPSVRVGVPAELWATERAHLATALAWPLEWLEMRRFVVGKGLQIDWHPLAAAAAASVAPPPSTRRLAGTRRGRLAPT
jgi:hypothetical protein